MTGPGGKDSRTEEPDDDALPLEPVPLDTPSGEGPTVYVFIKDGEPERLDRFLCGQLPGRSRAFLQRLLETGCVTLEPGREPVGREVKPALKITAGSRVRVSIPVPRKLNLAPEDIPIRIIHEDPHLAVIEKPPLLAVHPAPDQVSQTLVNALLFHLRELSSIGGVERPGIVHRLDKETSGVLVVAKNDLAHQSLARQFKERCVRKTYLAISRGEPEAWEGHIERRIGKSYTHAKKQMIRVDGTGREAVTEYRVLEKYRGYSLIEVYPRTGRTHQIRVHLASLRLPVACDKLYGREKRIYLSDLKGEERRPDETPLMERHALHASSISFEHPVTRERLTFSAPLEPDMHALLKALERYREIGSQR